MALALAEREGDGLGLDLRHLGRSKLLQDLLGAPRALNLENMGASTINLRACHLDAVLLELLQRRRRGGPLQALAEIRQCFDVLP